MTRIVRNKGKPDVSGVKRLFIPGLVVGSRCPECECEHESQVDLADTYVSHFGEMGGVETLGFYCSECENEWEGKIRLRIEAKAVVAI